MTEREKILTMLAEGQLSVAEAEALLSALDSSAPQAPNPPKPPKPKGSARLLRVQINGKGDKQEKVNLNVNIPIGLAKFVSKFIPETAKLKLDEQGINLVGLLESLGDDLPDGRLVDIDASDENKGEGAKILVEVV